MESLEEIKAHYLKNDNQDFRAGENFLPGSIGHYLAKNSKSKTPLPKLVIIGIPDNRGSSIAAKENNIQFIRRELYRLFLPQNQIKFEDWGILIKGKKLSDTYEAISTIVDFCLQHSIVPLFYGGGHNMTYGQFLGLRKSPYPISLGLVDSKIDLRLSPQVSSKTFLGKIISDYGENLFNISIIGTQRYYIAQNEIDLMENLYFDLIRLGQLRKDFPIAEPYLRDCELISFDLGSVKQADSPGVPHLSVNGFTSDEICQLAWYAGNSDKVKCFGLHEYDAENDTNNVSANLAAQILWHFIDGFVNQESNKNNLVSKNYSKSIFELDVLNHKITFVYDEVEEKWWMEIPADKELLNDYLLVSCSKSDYLQAQQGEIPDKWWKTYQKIS